MTRSELVDALLTIYFLIRLTAVILLSAFLLLKALVFRRAGPFGNSIAKSNVSIVVAFVGSIFLLAGFAFFGTWPWSLGVLMAVTTYAVKAAHQMAILYDGWDNLLHEARLTLIEMRGDWRRQPVGMKIALVVLLLELFAAVALTQVRGVPPELVLPHRSADATPEPKE